MSPATQLEAARLMLHHHAIRLRIEALEDAPRDDAWRPGLLRQQAAELDGTSRLTSQTPDQARELTDLHGDYSARAVSTLLASRREWARLPQAMELAEIADAVWTLLRLLPCVPAPEAAAPAAGGAA